MNNPFKRKKPDEPTALENFCWAAGVIGLLGGAYWWITAPVSEARIQSFVSGDTCYRAELTKVLEPGYDAPDVVDGGSLVLVMLKCRDQSKAQERVETIARQTKALHI